MKIVVFKYGEALYPAKRVFRGLDTEENIPMSFCFYLIDAEDRKILVDAGCMGKEHYKMYAFENPLELLKQYGLSADEITDVIVTHGHFDHMGEIFNYKNATVYIQTDEKERGRGYLRDGMKLRVFDEKCDVTSDVRVERYGGHTSGSCIVFVKERNVICGDECYYQKNFDTLTPIGNTSSVEKSQRFVETYNGRDGKYNPFLFHDDGIMTGRVGFEIVFEE